MKTKLTIVGLILLGITSLYAQAGARVYAKNSDISDNLDLRAVASIFGESRDLEDFERRINNPEYRISNLDLNEDDQVDYLRVIETVENRTHLIVLQAVLGYDVYQDVATIDVERNNYNKVSIQVVGNDYLFGPNYIYEPVYVNTPVIYASFWLSSYRPYYSTWRWNYYPTYYVAWNPFPIYRYRTHVNYYINVNNHYNYVTSRRSNTAVVLYNSRRSNGYERMRPNYSFTSRNSSVNNRYELEQRRGSYNQTRRDARVNQPTYSNRTSTNRTDANRRYAENKPVPAPSNNSRYDNRSESKSYDNRNYNNRSYSSKNNTNRDFTPSKNHEQNNRNNNYEGTANRTPNTPNYGNSTPKNREYTDNGASRRTAQPSNSGIKNNSQQARAQQPRSNGNERSNSNQSRPSNNSSINNRRI